MDSKSGIIKQYHTDEYGNPISVLITDELQQVSSKHNAIQLYEVPDEYNRLVVKSTNGTILNEVFDIEQITDKSYKVNYNSGVVHFSKNNAGKTFKITYYGCGVEMLHVNRIAMGDNPLGFDNVQQVVDENVKALHLSKTIHDAYVETEVGRNVAETDRRVEELARVEAERKREESIGDKLVELEGVYAQELHGIKNTSSENKDKITILNSEIEKTNIQLSDINDVVLKKQDKFFTTPYDYKHLVVDGDWTQAFQSALNNRGTVFIPHGEYMITEPLVVYGGTKLVGENSHPRGTIGTRICGNFVGDNLICVSNKGDVGELDYAEDVVIEDLTLVNWDAVKKGIYSTCVSRLTLKNLYLDKFNTHGIHIQDSWITDINKVTVIGKGSTTETIAFSLFGTSCNMQNCYAFNCRNGYSLELYYSTISACASDHIGNATNYGIVYDLKGYNTGLLNCGAEQCYGTLVRASERACNVKGMSAVTHYVDSTHPLFCNYDGDKVSDSFTIEDVSVVFRDFTSLNGEKIYSWKAHEVNGTDISVNRVALYQNNQSFSARKLNVYEYKTEYLGNVSKINFKNNDFINNRHGHIETLNAFDKVKYFRVKNGSHLTFNLFNANADDINPYNDNSIHGSLEIVCRTSNVYVYNHKSFGSFEFNVYNDSDNSNAVAYSIVALHIKSDVSPTNICIKTSSTDPYDIISMSDIDESILEEKTKVI